MQQAYLALMIGDAISKMLPKRWQRNLEQELQHVKLTTKSYKERMEYLFREIAPIDSKSLLRQNFQN